jgi:AcrR family transcriptional regulator
VGDEISRVGPERVRMGRVAELANVSRASLYRYFASKDELITAYTMRELDRLFEGADAAMEEYKNFDDRLCAAFTFAVMALEEHHAFQALLKFGERRVLKLTLLSSETLDHARDLTVERINDAVGDGRVRFDPFDAAVAAEVVVRLCVSLMATPDSVARLETRDDTFAFSKRYVVPMVYALGAGRGRGS